MLIPDVNILVYAFHEQGDQHVAMRAWLQDAVHGNEAVGLCDAVLVGFLRVATLPIWRPPASLPLAISFIERLREAPACRHLAPHQRAIGTMLRLCADIRASGNIVPDAWLAALAIEHGATLITADAGFARFPGLAWKHPLNGRGS